MVAIRGKEHLTGWAQAEALTLQRHTRQNGTRVTELNEFLCQGYVRVGLTTPASGLNIIERAYAG